MASPTPAPTASACSGFVSCITDAAGRTADALGSSVSGAVQTVDFWTDPWGNTFRSLQSAAHNLAASVLPAVTKATLPDLNAKWFLSAYAVAFALAVFVAVVLLIPQILRTARGMQAGRELAESVGIYFPLFLVGAMFGPPAGVVLVNFFQSLSDSIVGWGVTGSTQSVTAKFQAMLTAGDANGIAGGAPVGVLLMVLMLTGLLLVVVMLVVQLVTLYFTGVLVPLGLVWLIDPERRRFGTRIVTLWVGVLASHPLLFFLLSVAYLMVASSVDAFGSNASLHSVVQLIVSVLALFLAGLSPFVLMKLAPVLPMGGGASRGPALLGTSIGAQNLTEADDRYSVPPPKMSSQPSSAPSTATGSGGEDTPSGPSKLSEVREEADKPAPTTTGRAPSSTTAVKPVESAGSTSAADAEPAAVGATSPAAAGAAGAAAGGGGAAAAAGECAVAAGVAESATGIGAAVGVPTILAGLAVGGAHAVQRGVEEIGDHVTAPIDDHETKGGSGRA